MDPGRSRSSSLGQFVLIETGLWEHWREFDLTDLHKHITEKDSFISHFSLRAAEVDPESVSVASVVSELTDFILKGCCLALDVALLPSFSIHLTLT